MRIGIAEEIDDRIGAIARRALQPDLADTAIDLVRRIAGGIRMREPAADLGITVALISSRKDIIVSDRTIVFGEVGLSGEIRAVSMCERRVLEAKKLGFTKVIMPKANHRSLGNTEGMEIIEVASLDEIGY